MTTTALQRTSVRIHAGFTLTELMLSLTLGTLIVLAATGLVVAARAAQSTQFAAASIQDTALYALNNIARSVRQAGLMNFERDDAPIFVTEGMSPSIFGLDNATLSATSPGIENPKKSTNYASDVLAIRFFGSGTADAGNSVLNCGGFGVSAPTSQRDAEQERGWSIYYVANDGKGIPNLYCKYKKEKFTAQSIAQGVEAFRVLYGIETGNDPSSITLQFLDASAINALDAKMLDSDRNSRSTWKKITAVKIALLIRSENNANAEIGGTAETSPAVYDLFGSAYSNAGSAGDHGTQIPASSIAQEQKGKIRKIIGTTIQLRNSVQ